MNRPLKTSGAFDLLTRLREVVTEFAQREKKLNQQFKIDTTARKIEHDEKISQLKEEHDKTVDRLKRSQRGEQERLKKKTALHESRIHKAARRVAAATHAEIEEKTGHQKNTIQKNMIEADRARPELIAQAEQKHQTFAEHIDKLSVEARAIDTQTHKAFRGYRHILKEAQDAAQPAATETSDLSELIDLVETTLAQSRKQLVQFKRNLLPALFATIPLPVLLVLSAIGIFAAIPLIASAKPGMNYTPLHAGGLFILTSAALTGLFVFGKNLVRNNARTLARQIENNNRIVHLSNTRVQSSLKETTDEIELTYANRFQDFDSMWKYASESAAQERQNARALLDVKEKRLMDKLNISLEHKAAKLSNHFSLALAQVNDSHEHEVNSLQNLHQAFIDKSTQQFESDWSALVNDWNETVPPALKMIQDSSILMKEKFPDWQSDYWKNWSPPSTPLLDNKFGDLSIDLNQLCPVQPEDPLLSLPSISTMTLPLALSYPSEGSIIFETSDQGHPEAIQALNNIALRILTTAPPASVRFTIIDPIGLGQNFSGITHLADNEDSIIGGRIWTQPRQIESCLMNTCDHMEKVIQMYLRNTYTNITDYNQEAGDVAEKYHFIVIADFPSNFSDIAIRRLQSIAESGHRCGVFTLLHWNASKPLPPDIQADDLRKHSLVFNYRNSAFTFFNRSVAGLQLELEQPPPAKLATDLVHIIGDTSDANTRIELPFSHIRPKPDEVWTQNTTDELSVAIGRAGANKLQHLLLGRGTRQHVLVAGKTGSGKSTLFHVIITNLALWCRPDQVEFYLVDFKKGVEFKCYARPEFAHARVVAVESDREFGLSVLESVDNELKRRGELFRKHGVNDLAGYAPKKDQEPLPRTILLIDEFQEFFVEDDRISQNANLLLDRLVRQGRAFGIHVILGSQTLGGAYTLARTTLGQMVVRVALQCNESDAFLIMDDGNSAPRLLSRPGEAIYNDEAGRIEGNSPFQVVWLPDDERERIIQHICSMHEASPSATKPPIIFEGNAPVTVQDNIELRHALKNRPTSAPMAPRIWLGEPNSIKEPSHATFHRQSGNHLLVVGQRDEACLALVTIGLLSLAAQYPKDELDLYLIDSSPARSPQETYLHQVLEAIPHTVQHVAYSEIGDQIHKLATQVQSQNHDRTSFLFINGLHNFKELVYEEDYGFSTEDSEKRNPGRDLNILLREGSRSGVHVVALIDTYNNVNRYLSRKAVSEFEMRVLFQMSANDSSSLIDSPQASNLGLYRAIYHHEANGITETFRPYALPENEWIEEAGKTLKQSQRAS